MTAQTVTFEYQPRAIFQGLAFSAIVECHARTVNEDCTARHATYQAAHHDGFQTRNAALQAAQAMARHWQFIERTRRATLAH